MACNGLFGIGEGTMISPPSSTRYFDLSMADIAVFDRDCNQLILDLTMVIGMAKVSIVHGTQNVLLVQLYTYRLPKYPRMLDSID